MSMLAKILAFVAVVVVAYVLYSVYRFKQWADSNAGKTVVNRGGGSLIAQCKNVAKAVWHKVTHQNCD